MNKIYFLSLTALLFCAGLLFSCAPQSTLSHTPAPAETSDDIRTVSGKTLQSEQLDKFILHLMDSVGVPGLSIALINDAEVVYQRSFGTTNISTGEKVNEQTLFEAASLSKPVFAYFAMRMADKGLLDLDKPMHEYLPHPGIDSASQAYYRLITPRMILSHSAGFPNWSHGKKIHLPFKPGTGFSYSGEAYQYLAAVIGQLNGVGWEQRLDSVFQQEVAIPLGLDHSWFTWNEYIEKNKATGHEQDQPTDAGPQGKAFGAAYSLHTEAADYARFLIAMMDGTYLKEASAEEMLREQNHFSEDEPLLETGQTGWGLGFARKPTAHGLRYLHTGNNHDFQSYCCFYKDKKYGLVLFMNADKIEPFYARLGEYLEDEF